MLNLYAWLAAKCANFVIWTLIEIMESSTYGCIKYIASLVREVILEQRVSTTNKIPINY